MQFIRKLHPFVGELLRRLLMTAMSGVMRRVMKNMQGFTLLELLITLTVAAIILKMAIPSYFNFMDKQKLKAAAESIYSDIQYARSEALKQNQDMVVSFETTQWCYGINEVGGCDCTTGDNCQVNGVEKVTSSINLPDVALSNVTFTSNNLTLDSARGTANSGELTLTSDLGLQLKVQVNLLGRIKVCYPGTLVTGYKACS